MDKKFESKHSLSSACSNKTSNTNESNKLIKQPNENVTLLQPQSKHKHIADYFEESLNIFNVIQVYLEKSQKNNSVSIYEYIRKIKSHYNNIHSLNTNNENNKRLSLTEKEIMSEDIEKRSLERKRKYNELFDNINESILNIKNCIHNNGDIIKYNSESNNDVFTLSPINKEKGVKNEDMIIYDGSDFHGNKCDKDELCDLEDSVMEEQTRKTIINNNDVSTINGSESDIIINNNDDYYSMDEKTDSSISNCCMNVDNIQKHQFIAKSFSKYAYDSNIIKNMDLKEEQSQQNISNNNNCFIY